VKDGCYDSDGCMFASVLRRRADASCSVMEGEYGALFDLHQWIFAQYRKNNVFRGSVQRNIREQVIFF